MFPGSGSYSVALVLHIWGLEGSGVSWLFGWKTWGTTPGMYPGTGKLGECEPQRAGIDICSDRTILSICLGIVIGV